MNPWVYVALAAAVVVAVPACVAALRAGRRSRAELASRLSEAQRKVAALGERVEALTNEVVETRQLAEEQTARRDVAPFLITGLVERSEGDRQAQVVQAIEASSPHWVPAKPLREALVRTVSLGHGVRRALSPDSRDRILLEMRAEVRRSRRQRKAELKAVRKYLRDRRRSAA